MYKIGITSYDNDHELWETHIGDKNMNLLYSSWGETEEQSKLNANELLNKISPNDGRVIISHIYIN